MKGIALCGFMGCGKTTVANTLSSKYNLRHIDTDKFIEETEKLSISKMFELYGEEYFRDKEFESISKLSKSAECVLSLGGGAVMHERNVDVLKANGYAIVFIDTDLSVIKRRLRNDTTRPLLKTSNVDMLYAKRLAIYMSVADVIITCTDESSEQIADMIINELKKA